MKVDKDLPSEIRVVKGNSSSHKKTKLDEIISYAKLLYEDFVESDGIKNIDHTPFVGRLARIIEKLENFKEKEL
ncbi:MAG: hypothetical protein GEU26_12485 [Nitrososphaeraceae archaeon]|nr:hypothetical protein [Nitrososphaeraceae archaeon]